MGKIARGILGAAILYGLAGLAAGLLMAITEDHSQMPTHAHIMVIGWVSFFLFSLFYDRFEDRVSGILARLHFWSAQLSLLPLIVGLWLLYSGREEFTPLAAGSAIGYAVSFVIFAAVALPIVRAK